VPISEELYNFEPIESGEPVDAVEARLL